jgi:hypothetical protein
MHEVYHIISASNKCRNSPDCLVEHETLAALVEEAHRRRPPRVRSEGVHKAFRVVFRDYIVPLVPACRHKAQAKRLHDLMLRRFLANCRRRSVLKPDNSFNTAQFGNAVQAGLDHFHNRDALVPLHQPEP